MPRKPPPLSSFGPELQTALRAGAQQNTKITFSDDRTATRFAARINQLRQAMRAHNHPDADHLYRCGVYREGSVVTLRPKDSEFGEALKSLETLPKGAPEASAKPLESSTSPSAVESFLSDLEVEKKPPEGENKG